MLHRCALHKLHLRYSQDTRDQITSDKRFKSASSNCILDIPFILSEHPNEDWLHTCDACTNHVGPNTIGKARKWHQQCQPILAKPYSSLREMTGQYKPQLPEMVPYSQQRESTVGEDYVTQGKFRYTIVLTSSQISYQE